jgi:hypothetical protein
VPLLFAKAKKVVLLQALKFYFFHKGQSRIFDFLAENLLASAHVTHCPFSLDSLKVDHNQSTPFFKARSKGAFGPERRGAKGGWESPFGRFKNTRGLILEKLSRVHMMRRFEKL